MKGTALDSFSGAPPTSRENFVYEALKEAILSGQLKPNDTIGQTTIAEKLGVSPIPVRAAISRLIAEGLMCQELHHSPRVSSFSHDNLEEVLMVRMHLEVLATKLAVPAIQPEHLSELRSLLGQMGEVLKTQELYHFGSLNKAFHLKLYESCRYPLLRKMIKDLWDKADMHRSRSMFSLIPGLAEESYAEHTELLQLVEAKQADLAAALLERHKVRALTLFLRVIQEQQL